jgi:Flp pilus assembly protein TadG
MCIRTGQKQGQHRTGFMHRFFENESGSATIFMIFILMIMLMMAGIGVDIMRYETERARIQNALDNAVLAAADMEQTQEPRSVVLDYMDKLASRDSIGNINVIENTNMRQVSADGDFQMNTLFMHLSGVDTLNGNLQTAAIEQAPNAEVSLLLDISGSMQTNNRDDVMRTAAKEFISKVLERNVTQDGFAPTQTSVNVVPFAGQTNPGPEMFEYLGGERFGTTTSANYFPEWAQDTSNVVFWFDTDNDGVIDFSAKIEGYPDNDVAMFNKDDLDEYYLYAIDYIERVALETMGVQLDGSMEFVGASIKGGRQPTSFYSVEGDPVGENDVPLPDDGPTKFNQTDLSINFNDFYTNIVPNNESSCIEMSYGDFFNTGLPDSTNQQTPHFVNWDFDSTEMEWGWCPSDDFSIEYAQKDELALHTFIDDLKLHDGTGTNYGMKWALALLDPDTQPAFEYLSQRDKVPAEFANRPLRWSEPLSTKYIVVMSDGSIGTQIRPSDTLDLSNDDTELTERPAEDTMVASSNFTNLQLFHAQCDLAKAQGVVVYTVAFETSQRAADDLAKCASSPAHFFDVDGLEVVDAFVAIASSIKRLRLTL